MSAEFEWNFGVCDICKFLYFFLVYLHDIYLEIMQY